MRFQPERSVDILKRGLPSQIDPPLFFEEKDYTSRMILDATVPYEWVEQKQPIGIKLTEEIVESQKDMERILSFTKLLAGKTLTKGGLKK